MKEAIRERDPEAVLLVDFSARSEEAIRLLHPSERLIEKRRKKNEIQCLQFPSRDSQNDYLQPELS
jgi:hypothetical protein